MRPLLPLFATVSLAACSSVPSAAPGPEGASIAVSPATIAFDAQPGDPLPPQSVPVRVANAGDVPLRVLAAELVPHDAPGFRVLAPAAFPLTIAAGEEVEILVELDPANAATPASALAIESDDLAAPHVEVAVTTGAAPRPSLVCDPAVLHLAQSPGTPASRAVRCGNEGGAAAEGVTLSVEGAGLEVSLFGGPVDLGPGEWTEPFLVTWTPATTGPATGSVRLSSPLSSTAIAIDAVGTTSPPCAHRVDSFVQPGPPVDILAVIDDSSSMNDNLGAAVSALHGLTGRLADAGASFHLGITTTDVYNGSYSENGKLVGTPRVIDADTPELYQRVFESASVPTSYYDIDTNGLEAIELALGPALLAGANAGFLREGSALHVIVLSDGDDVSPHDALYYATFLRALQDGDENRIAAHAVTGPCASAYGSGADFQSLATELGGTIAQICDEDAGDALLPIADFAGRDRLTLAASPLAESIRVRVGGQTRPFASWLLDGSRLRLLEIPAPGKTVSVEYDFGCSN